MTTVTAFSEGYKQSSNATDYYQKMRALHTCLDRVHMRDDER